MRQWAVVPLSLSECPGADFKQKAVTHVEKDSESEVNYFKGNEFICTQNTL